MVAYRNSTTQVAFNIKGVAKRTLCFEFDYFGFRGKIKKMMYIHFVKGCESSKGFAIIQDFTFH
jgi:hypothetical protein